MGRYKILLKRMFDEMVIPRDSSKIAEFYHREFWMSTNQIEQGYEDFYADHVQYYSEAAQMTYSVEYDDDSFSESKDGVSARLWITTSKANAEPTRIEVILIAKYVDGKLHRLWELTLPNWASLDAFTR